MLAPSLRVIPYVSAVVDVSATCMYVRMDSPSFRTAFQDLLGKYRNTDAVIVDTRYNGGGWPTKTQPTTQWEEVHLLHSSWTVHR